MNSSNNVLFYSNKCVHSKELLNLIMKDTKLNQKITKVNVDNPNIKLPPYVKSVPSMICNDNKKPTLLVGSKIFDWYNDQHKENVSTNSIQDWDPCTMSGYSDGFSYLENEDVMKKSYSFINAEEKINTPDESNYEASGQSGGNQQKTQLDVDYESFMSSRSNDVAAPIQRMA